MRRPDESEADFAFHPKEALEEDLKAWLPKRSHYDEWVRQKRQHTTEVSLSVRRRRYGFVKTYVRQMAYIFHAQLVISPLLTKIGDGRDLEMSYFPPGLSAQKAKELKDLFEEAGWFVQMTSHQSEEEELNEGPEIDHKTYHGLVFSNVDVVDWQHHDHARDIGHVYYSYSSNRNASYWSEAGIKTSDNEHIYEKSGKVDLNRRRYCDADVIPDLKEKIEKALNEPLLAQYIAFKLWK